MRIQSGSKDDLDEILQHTTNKLTAIEDDLNKVIAPFLSQ